METEYHDTYAYTHTHTFDEVGYGPLLIIFIFLFYASSSFLLAVMHREWANYIMRYMFFLLEVEG